MDDEKLVLLVQNHDLLYNKFNRSYKIPEAKRKAWIEIANNMGLPMEIVTKRWTTLRDRYVKERKQDNPASGSGINYKSRWYLMSAMEFLAPHITPRPMRSSTNIVDEFILCSPSFSPLTVDITNTSESSSPLRSPTGSPLVSPSSNILFNTTKSLRKSNERKTTILSPIQLSAISPSPNKQIDFTTPSLPSSSNARKTATQPPAPNEILQKKRKQNDSSEIDLLFSEAVFAFKTYCESEQENNRKEENGTLEGFGKMIISTIGTMSARKQVTAMQMVTALVMDLKLEPDD